MMEWKRKVSTWWSSSFSSSYRNLLRLIVPFLVAFGFVAFISSNSSFRLLSSWNSDKIYITKASWEGGDGGGGGGGDHHSPPPQAFSNASSPSIEEQSKESSIQPSIKENDKGTFRKKDRNLRRIEAGLVQARAAIHEANDDEIQDSDYIPKGPMYKNATAFYRSYKEMEKKFKIYIYEEGQPPIFHYGLCKNIYAIEGFFMNQLEVSNFRVLDPNKAHVYFLPFSVTMITEVVYVPDSHEWGPMKTTVSDYVNVLSQKHPYWNRSLGADHFMLACHDWGPELSFSVPLLYKNSIRALCNANTSEKFNPKKDVSIPEIYLPEGTMENMIGGPSPSQRKTLVFYAGGVHGPIRPILLQHWENKDEEVQVQKYLPKGVSYYKMMRNSRFCICPSGYEVASPRMVEALYMGCVPVLIKEGYVIPFSDVLNWNTFSVIIPVKDIPNMKKILTAISQRQYIRMQRRGVQMRRHFEVNSPPKRFDVFHMILHSIWLRRLNVQVNDIDHQQDLQ